MGLLTLLGAGLVKGAKYLYKHRNEIRDATEMVRSVTGSNSYASDDYEEEYASAPTLPAAPENGQVIELNEDQMTQLLAEIAESLQKMEKEIAALAEGQTAYDARLQTSLEAVEKVKQDLVRLAGSVTDNSESVAKLQKTIEKLDAAIADSYNQVALVKQECAQRIADMAQQLKVLEDAQAADRKKAEERYGNMCLFLVFGVAVAIALAIFL